MSHSLRRGLAFLGFCLVLGAVLPLLSRGEGPPLGERYALLVGVRNYDKNELRNLPYAEDDMTALADVLKRAGYTRVVLMTQTHGADEQRFLPEAAKIRTALKGLLADRAADGSVLVAFAGHGVQYQGEDENYFCPMDAKLADRYWASGRPSSSRAWTGCGGWSASFTMASVLGGSSRSTRT